MNLQLLKAAVAATSIMVVTSANSQTVERKVASPTSVIASTVTIPPNATIVYLSGATGSPVDPKVLDTPDAYGDTAAQTLSILGKLKAQLADVGMTMGDVVKINVFLVGDPKLGGKMDREGMNRVFATFFGTAEQPNKPARSSVQVASLGRPQTLVEIEGVAAKVK